LVVVAYPVAQPTKRVDAVVNHTGVYIWRKLPGMHTFESGAGDATFWASLPPRQPYVIEVVDSERRFLPFILPVDLPLQGLLPWECEAGASPLEPLTSVPLFSSPNRAVPGGMAVVRAHLWDADQNRPAAWAVLEVRLPDNRIVRGLADDQGRVTVIFAYPEPQLSTGASPPGSPLNSGRRPLAEQTWTLQLNGFYAALDPTPPIPDLCQALTQGAATLYAGLSPATPLLEATLAFGKELVLKSGFASNLFITPAG
jgi:hypothetical protein